jgi:hypothetical protein
MTAKAFHDAILRENAIPIDMIRASLMQTPLTTDYRPDWKFYHRQEPVHAKPEAQLQSNPDNRLPSSVEEALSVGKSFRGKVTQGSIKAHNFTTSVLWKMESISFEWFIRKTAQIARPLTITLSREPWP